MADFDDDDDDAEEEGKEKEKGGAAVSEKEVSGGEWQMSDSINWAAYMG